MISHILFKPKIKLPLPRLKFYKQNIENIWGNSSGATFKMFETS
jgi:hypothetical protein